MAQNHSSNTDPFDGTLFDVLLSVQSIVTFAGFAINCLLFYGQAKSRWPFYQRALCLNITLAAAVASGIHGVQGALQVWEHMEESGDADEGFWPEMIADSAQAAVAIGLLILACQNLLALKQCDRRLSRRGPNEDRVEKGRPGPIVAMVLSAWTTATVLVWFNLDPQAKIHEETENPTKFSLSLTVGLLLEISVAISLLITSRTLRRLEADFSVRGAQQNLATRIHIKGTIALTGTIARVLICHVVVWIASVALQLGLDQLAGKHERERDEESGEKTHPDDLRHAALTSVVDTVTMSFDALYPFVVMWKQPQLRRRMVSMRCGKVAVATETSRHTNPPPVIPMTTIVPVADVHRTAIEGHWNKVAAVKFSRKTSLPPVSRIKSAKPKKDDLAKY